MLGAYALGQLTPAEEEPLRSHLESCAVCRRELDEITPAVNALVQLRSGKVAEESSPPVQLGNRIVAAVSQGRQARQQRGRRRSLLAAAAVVTAVLSVGGVGALVGHEIAEDRPAATGPVVPIEEVSVKARQKQVEASAGVVAHTWGVEIKLRAVGLRRGTSYSTIVTTVNGARRSAGGFVGTGKRVMNCNLNSDVLRKDATRFAVLDDQGRTILTADL
jgi:hypothetical protein